MNHFVLDGYEALGTVWYIEVFDNEASYTKEVLIHTLEHAIQSFQRNYSRFEPDSIVSTLNKQKKVPQDTHLLAMLTRAQDMYVQTERVFDMYIERDLIKKGYGMQNNEIYKQAVCCSDSPHGGISFFNVVDNQIILHGTKTIDLGGIGKGYLIDLLVSLLKQEGITQFLINGGGDMYGTHCNGEGIDVYLQHPRKKDILIGKMKLMNKAFCSSSSYVRTWEHHEVMKNHFISPSKEEVWAASFVVADTARVADMMATVLCVTSHNKELSYALAQDTTIQFLAQHEDEEFFGDLFPRISEC